MIENAKHGIEAYFTVVGRHEEEFEEGMIPIVAK